MNFEDIIERIGWGEEFLFYYNNEEYWISQNNSNFYLTKVKGATTQEFKNPYDLFENGIIEGKNLTDIWDDIKQCF